MHKCILYYSGDAGSKDLEEQHAEAREHIRWRRLTLLAEYTDHRREGATRRPELRKALDHADRAEAVLVIARLNNLIRDAGFLATLGKSGAKVTACDAPYLTRWTIYALEDAAVRDSRRRSERTKAGLAAYKALGGRLGTAANLTPEARRRGQLKGSRKNSELARTAYLKQREFLPRLQQLRIAGASLREIAETLNREGYRTRRRAPWNHNQVKRVLDRFQTELRLPADRL